MNEIQQMRMRLVQIESELQELRDNERMEASRAIIRGPDRDALFHPFRVKRNGPTTAMTALVSDGVANAGAPGSVHGKAHKYLEANHVAFNLTADFAVGDHVLYMEVTLSDETDPESVTLTPKGCTAAEFLTKNTDTVCAQLLFSFTNATVGGTKRTTKTRQELFSDFCVPIHSEIDGYGATVWRVSWAITNVGAAAEEQLRWSLQADNDLISSAVALANGTNAIPIAAVQNQWAKTDGNTIQWKSTSTGTYRITARVNLHIDAENMLLEFFELSFKTNGVAVARPAKYLFFLDDNSYPNSYADDEQSIERQLYFEAIVTQYALGDVPNTTSCAIVNNTVALVVDATILQTGWYITSSVVTVERLHDVLADSVF